jgi:ankyrin repeat protein
MLTDKKQKFALLIVKLDLRSQELICVCIDIFCLLLDRGAEIEANDTNNSTALHCAVRNGHLEVVRQLLEEGANINTEGRTTD